MHGVGPFILCQGQGLIATLHPALPGRVYYIVMSKIGTPDNRLPISTSMDRRKSLRQLSKPGKASRIDLNPMLCGVQKKTLWESRSDSHRSYFHDLAPGHGKSMPGQSIHNYIMQGGPIVQVVYLKLIHSMCCATQQAKRVQNTPAIYISVFLSKKRKKSWFHIAL